MNPDLPARGWLSVCLCTLLLAAGGSVVAQEATSEMPMARIVGAGGWPAQCLAPVQILEVDGDEVQASPRGFELEAGWHSLNGRAEIALDHCRPAGLARGPAVPDLQADFQAGGTYHIALDHRSPEVRDWRLVIWKVEMGEGGSAADDGQSHPGLPGGPLSGGSSR